MVLDRNATISTCLFFSPSLFTNPIIKKDRLRFFPNPKIPQAPKQTIYVFGCLGVLIFPSSLFTPQEIFPAEATTTSRRSSAMARTFRWTTWTCRRRRKRRRKRWNHPRRKRRSRKWNGWELPMWVDNEVSGMVRVWECTYRVGYLFFFGERMFQVCINVIFSNFCFNWSWGNILVLVLWWLKKKHRNHEGSPYNRLIFGQILI